jgi:hypothetical protein
MRVSGLGDPVGVQPEGMVMFSKIDNGPKLAARCPRRGLARAIRVRSASKAARVKKTMMAIRLEIYREGQWRTWYEERGRDASLYIHLFLKKNTLTSYPSSIREHLFLLNNTFCSYLPNPFRVALISL